ncbi:AAA family ATPase [Pseudobutyrivibrio sp. LB2011]|uniref:AAA family ATPase n=1 Tax=Pseudobutyrivibrio sp. LB2011 TaxID=1408312 RepID=UPI0005D225A9|nr:SMC family ATPase [Pseudobutyrivibrio sp. LB2011]
MRPLKIEFQAFGPYAGHEIVDFKDISEKGLFLICGKTGMGKTMILDAMTFALYGKSSGHGRDDFEAMRCTNAEFDKTTYVKFEFEIHGDIYLFERRLERKRKNLSPAYSLMKKDEDGIWRTMLENAKEKALNEKAVEIIGLEYEQFRQVIVLPQGQFEKLLTSNSDEKEKILTSIFGEEKWQLIAEQLYNSIVERRENLKGIKEKIGNSLKEEHCETIYDLSLVISHKEKELLEIDEEYKVTDYDKLIKEKQDALILAKRFGDLHKAENRIEILKSQSSDRKEWEKQIQDANRAEKVRVLIEVENKTSQELNNRKNNEKSVRNNALEAKKNADNVELELREHLKQEKELELKKSLKISYENKRSEYEGIESAIDELNAMKLEEKKAMDEEREKKTILDSLSEKIIKIRNQYIELNESHSMMLEKYLAGITGELAEKLEKGKPCPVCGSTIHPQKAVKADNSVTKEMVDEKKNEVDLKYSELQDATYKHENAKKEYDSKLKVVGERHKDVAVLESRVDDIKKNLIDGISDLSELNKSIVQLDEDICLFEEQKKQLEEKKQKANNDYMDANAKIEPATEETQKAQVIYDSAQKAVEEGLIANRFESVDEVEAVLLDEETLSKIKQKITDYDTNLKAAKDNLKDISKELKGKEVPNEAECERVLEELNDSKTNYKEKRAVLNSDIERLTKKYKMLEAEGKGIEAKIREAEEDFVFAKKLRGDTGTGLQRYVLGIMFSSVVAAANKMLEMVHGGRYRLYRSDEKAQGTNKRGLDLKVFDKNSEDHEGRFVSTLSGGEKFLASLALSIGMSTVAQKSGIKIEALFIDEGFGSLDEDSIGDAMNVLNSIQEANGLVGIISHVQLLQDRIPTKLKVEESSRGSHIIQTIG